MKTAADIRPLLEVIVQDWIFNHKSWLEDSEQGSPESWPSSFLTGQASLVASALGCADGSEHTALRYFTLRALHGSLHKALCTDEVYPDVDVLTVDLQFHLDRFAEIAYVYG